MVDVTNDTGDETRQVAATTQKATFTSGERLPLEIWTSIFSYAARADAKMPKNAVMTEQIVQDADFYFDTEQHTQPGGDPKVESALHHAMVQRIKLAQVCKEWRIQNVQRIYERIHMVNTTKFASLVKALEHSKTAALYPGGYGGWVKEFSWRLKPVKGGAYPDDVVQSMAHAVRLMSNLIIFRPSPNVGCTNVPTPVIRALFQRENVQSLENLCLLGPVDSADFYEPFINPGKCKSLKSISLGAAWNAMSPDYKYDMPELRFIQMDMDDFCAYISHFTSGDLPKLEHVSITFRRPNPRLLDPFIASHGKKLKFLRMQMSKGFYAPAPQSCPSLRAILEACPNIEAIMYDLNHFREFDSFPLNSSIRRIGVFTSTILWKFSLPSGQREHFVRFRDVKLPKSTKVVRMMDILAPSMRTIQDRELGNMFEFFVAWAKEWNNNGVRLEDSRGLVFSMTG